MLRNYIKIDLRNMIKNRGTTLINMTGLSIGLTVVIMIGLWVQSQLSYDSFHKNQNRIHLIKMGEFT